MRTAGAQDAPAASINHNSIARSLASSQSCRVKKNSPVIAVVDDEPAFINALNRLLSLHGFAVDVYDDAESFLATCKDQRSDCLLLDIQMPGIDGFTVLERLGAKDGEQLPVIIITGNDHPDYRERATLLGAHAYFTKPFDGDSLVNAIRSCL